jgi:hypothetical protein
VTKNGKVRSKGPIIGDYEFQEKGTYNGFDMKEAPLAGDTIHAIYEVEADTGEAISQVVASGIDPEIW